jgi:monoterpene epsilon-lactone hydrolase
MRSNAYENLLRMLQNQPVDWRIPIPKQRENFETSAQLYIVGSDVRVEKTSLDGIPGEWLTPSNARSDRVLMYLHGGAYCIGSMKTHRALASNLARSAKARAINVDYRLAPEHVFPAALEDAVKAYRSLLEEGIPARNIIVAGDSAGGGLAMATLLSLRDQGVTLPRGAVVISPWTDLLGTGESLKTKASVDPILNPDELELYATMYCKGDLRDPLASPLYAELKGLPPLLIQVGTNEILLDDAVRLAERAKAAGVKADLRVADGMVHVWHLFSSLVPEGQAGIDEAGEWMRGLFGV